MCIDQAIIFLLPTSHWWTTVAEGRHLIEGRVCGASPPAPDGAFANHWPRVEQKQKRGRLVY